MTTRLDESIFGVQEPQQWRVHSEGPIAHTSDGSGSGMTDNQKVGPVAEGTQSGTEVQLVNTELHAIAGTIAELQSRLEEANSRLSNVEKVETTEVEMGRLFVEAQRFSESWLSKLELKIHEILGEAEAKAQQILVEATQEARQIRAEAQQAAFASSGTVRELHSAIAGFTTVNAELLKELGTLNGMLKPADQSAGEIDPASAPELDSTERG